MIRTVIAEDEKPLLRGIAAMVQRADESFVPVCLAKNGKEALEYLSQHEADVLFTDINMPLVDGISLMEQVRKVNPGMPVVVISGYNDFEYARQALRLGAVNYLLKPIDRGELEALLSELKEILEKNAHARKREAFIQALFGGRRAALSSLEFRPLSVLYLCAGNYQHEAGGRDLSVPGGLSDTEMLEILQQTEARENLWLFFGSKANEAIWIAEGELELNLSALRSQISRRLPEETALTAAFASGVKAEELPDRLTELEEWIRLGLIPGESRLLSEAPLPYEPEADFAFESLLKITLQRRDWGEFQTRLEQFCSGLPEEGRTQAALESFLAWVLTLVFKEAGEAAGEEPAPEIQVREFFEENEGQKEILRACTEYCRGLLQEDYRDAGSNEQLMREVDHYIREHLTEQLSLKDLSRRFGLVAPYLSKLFKAYKGMSPTEYMRELRMQHAGRMLRENPELLVKDIALSVGYENPLYFSRTFKKHTGVYPSEYRSVHREKEEQS